MFRHGLVCAIGLWLLLMVSGRAQDVSTSSSQYLSGYLKICSDKNPQPCADTSPKAIDTPNPQYSGDARNARIEGTVILGTIVGTDGRAYGIRVVQSIGHGLDEEAIKALKQWRFKPGTSKGEPVSVLISIHMDFHLHR